MISIIIPIYNVENYIKDLLISIQNQTYTDFEVIMINDGSSDGTATICKEYENTDTRFHYYYKENGGAGSARNMGLTLAKGEYIAFLDSDDTIQADYLQQLRSGFQNEQCSLVMSGIRTVKDGKTLYSLSLPEHSWNGDAFQLYVLCREIPVFLLQSTCAKMFKRQWLLEQRACFDEEISVSEDALFNTQLMASLTSDDIVVTLPYIGYEYRWDNMNSIQRSKKTFEKAVHGIMSSMRTLKIRRELAEGKFADDTKVRIGIRQAFAVVAICMANDIETNGFADTQRNKLYEMYLDDIQYDLADEYASHPYSERKILKFTMSKNPTGIHKTYQMRSLKKKVLSLFGR